MKRILMSLALTGLLAATAHADDKFGKMDTNGDGNVTWEEFHATYPQMQKAAFEAIDTDKKGHFDHEEWNKFLMNHQKSMDKGDGKGDGQGGMGGSMGGGRPPAAHPGDGSAKPMIMPPAEKSK